MKIPDDFDKYGVVSGIVVCMTIEFFNWVIGYRG